MMNIHDYYKILSVPPSASSEAVTAAYKKLALQYHPDRNRERIEWANEAMTKINVAYSEIMSYRFKQNSLPDTEAPEPVRKRQSRPTRQSHTEKPYPYNLREEEDRELLINMFIKQRENAKDALYRYFQYNLYNLVRREEISNQHIFSSVVLALRKAFHAIAHLAEMTTDSELCEHFAVFTELIFDFYRAAECINIIDSYNNRYDVEAYRVYKQGDEALHTSHKEIFYERHNRGKFRRDIAIPALMTAETKFMTALKFYPDSSWAVETRIKLEYVVSLKKYIELFFTNL